MVADMYGIFMESVVIFKNYAGNHYLILLFLASLIFLLFTEKNKRNRAFFVYCPLSFLFLFFFPIFRKVFVRLMGEGVTYYRMLWLIPMGVITAYAGVKLAELLEKKKGIAAKRVVLLGLLGVIVLGGKYVYGSPYMTKAENMYHLPQNVVDICDVIAPKDGEERIWAVFPTELVYFVRQYDTDIQMPYGREMVEPVWDYYNDVHEVMNHPTMIDIKALLEVSRPKYCTYIILPKNKAVTEAPEQYGLELLDTIDGYPVYYDGVAAEMIEEQFG